MRPRNNTIKRSTVAILHKDGIYGVIAVAITGTHNLVSNYDPRVHPHFFSRSFETPAIADSEFNESVATTRDRGFTVVYHGPRNFG